jgi:hypothetical protein
VSIQAQSRGCHETRLLAVGLSSIVAMVVVFAMALSWGVNHGHCKADFPTVISCTFEW